MAIADAPGNRVVRKIRIKAILFLVLALVAGAAAVALVKYYLDRLGPSKAAATTASVMVAKVDIPIGTELTAEHLKSVAWPAQNLPKGAFSTPKEVVGQTVQQNLVAGEPILHERLADETSGRGLTAILKKGTRAMAVKVDQVVGVAGFVKPGDYVDVITTMSPDAETKKEIKNEPARISKIILQNIKVLAVGEHMASKSGSKPVKVKVVTLEVNPDQSERLALASRYGVIQLTMRSRVDQESVPTAGITPVALLSPDEGVLEEEEPDQAKSNEAWLRQQRAKLRRARARAKAKAAPKKEEPAVPVIEVLRGNRIEERKLRPSADSK
jgi:pilus assembly protein CpaB